MLVSWIDVSQPERRQSTRIALVNLKDINQIEWGLLTWMMLVNFNDVSNPESHKSTSMT